MSFKSWIAQAALGDRRGAARQSGEGFSARHWAGEEVAVDSIRNISAIGVYLVTDKRWKQGTPVMLTLYHSATIGETSDDQVTLRAHVVRGGEDGVGLAFEIPAGLDAGMWLTLVKTAPRESEYDCVVGPLKTAKAMAFFHRICAPQGLGVWKYLGNTLGGARFKNAIEIGLQAEGFLGAAPERDELRASPRLVTRVLHDGSWAVDKDIQLCWAGLLAACCSVEQGDQSNGSFIEIFSQLTPAHARLLHGVCVRATKFLTKSGEVSARNLFCTAEEIMKLSGARDLLRMGRSLQDLSELGLLEERFKTSMFVPVERLNITPTSLGLSLFMRCSGFRGEPRMFFGLAGPRERVWQAPISKLG